MRLTRTTLAVLIIVAAAGSRCDDPRPPASKPLPRPGDFVKIRGTLSSDVDCRLLRTDDGIVYSLTSRLPTLINGARVCVHGTVIEVSQCLVQPTIEVQQVRAWSSCP